MLSGKDEGYLNELVMFLHPLWEQGIIEIIFLQ